MADLTIGTLTIKSDSVDYLKSNFLADKPNYMLIPDPEWIDPEDGTQVPMIKRFSDKQWFFHCIKEYVMAVCKKGKHIRDKKAALIENDIFV